MSSESELIDERGKELEVKDSDNGRKGNASRHISNTIEKTLIHITSVKISRGMTTQCLQYSLVNRRILICRIKAKATSGNSSSHYEYE